MRDRLIELLKNSPHLDTLYCEFEEAADWLLANGVIVPPDELYNIVDEGTIYASVSKAKVDWLALYVIKNPEKYGYYLTREEAEKALKGGAE